MPASPRQDFPFGQRIAWTPNPDWIAESNLRAFMDRHGIPDLDTLQARSVNEIEWFWSAVLEDLGIRFRTAPSRSVDLSPGPESPAWCPGARMNILDSLLGRWQAGPEADRPALRWEAEDGRTVVLTYQELSDRVGRCMTALSAMGLGRGDAVGLFMPMVPEIVVAFLAIIGGGGIVLPLFSGYGPEAVATRLRDAGARALFTADGFLRRGAAVRLKPVADEAVALCPTVERVIVVRHLEDDETPMSDGRDAWWHDTVPRHAPGAAYADTDAEDVLMVIYTSGTTGRPKGAVHTHCGFPVKAAQDMAHCMDVKAGNVVWWMTDMGWMMGPWLVFGTLAIGATMVLYDGAPDRPGPDRTWDLVARHGVTHLGLSPVLVRALRPHGEEPVRRHDLSRLRAVASTGSPWDPESWTWLFRTVLDGRKPILNYSGGTEISGGIVCGNFFRPLKPCAFSGPVPGMDADVVDDAGEPVRGRVGELVIRKPWIGMTRGFWKDKGRYLETYWSRFEGVWLHGDFAAIDDDGLWYILGRSDDTIKIAGKRVGPAEVESILNGHPAVLESAAIGVPDPVKSEVLVAFCVPCSEADDRLRAELLELVTTHLGKPMRPKAILFADALPRTRNAKIMRRVIRAAHLGLDPGDVTSLEDPSTLEAIRRAR
jgi:acetyl-CoA synthetase